MEDVSYTMYVTVMVPFQEPNKFGCSEGNVFDAETQVCKLAEEVRTCSLVLHHLITHHQLQSQPIIPGARVRLLVRLPGGQQVRQRLQCGLLLWSPSCLESKPPPCATSHTNPPLILFCTCCISPPVIPSSHPLDKTNRAKYLVSIYWTSKLA